MSNGRPYIRASVNAARHRVRAVSRKRCSPQASRIATGAASSELISKRYERRSLLITANQPFGEWNKIFPDPAMTVAAVDRLVHHATILEMNVESYRQRSATKRKGRAAAPVATPATTAEAPAV